MRNSSWYSGRLVSLTRLGRGARIGLVAIGAVALLTPVASDAGWDDEAECRELCYEREAECKENCESWMVGEDNRNTCDLTCEEKSDSCTSNCEE